jgi:hypothetical protein
VGVVRLAGEVVQEGIPFFAVLVPSAQGLDAEQSGFAESLLERGIVGDELHFFGEGVDVAVGYDEALLAVYEEVFGAGGGGCEDGTSAGHRLALNERETLLDAGQNEEMAGAHFFCELSLWKRSGKGDVLSGQFGEQVSHVVLQATNDSEVFAGVFDVGEGLQKIRDAFAEADLSGEEDLEGVVRRRLGTSEAVEADSVRNDVDFFRWDAHFEEGTPRDAGGDGDCIGSRVDLLLAPGDVRFGEWEGDVPAAVLFFEDLLLVTLVG